MTRWTDVDAPWQAALERSWGAYAVGTIPVGAVAADASGAVVAEGALRRRRPVRRGDPRSRPT